MPRYLDLSDYEQANTASPRRPGSESNTAAIRATTKMRREQDGARGRWEARFALT